MKDAFSEALKRRKSKGLSEPGYKEDEEKAKKQDLAPEVRDARPPDAKIELNLNLMPPEMGDAAMGMGSEEPEDMSSFVDEKEAAALQRQGKPKSLLQRAQMAFMDKKK